MIDNTELGVQFALWRYNENLLTIHGMSDKRMSIRPMIADAENIMICSLNELRQENPQDGSELPDEFLDSVEKTISFYTKFLTNRANELDSITRTNDLRAKLDGYKKDIIKNIEQVIIS